MKCLPVSVFRDADGHDCTNGGISSRYRQLLLICDDGFLDIDENDPPENLVKLVKRHLFGRDIYHIEPVERPQGAGWMMGGNYAATSDSRFSEMSNGTYRALAVYDVFADGAVPVHDRQETWEEYDMLSR